MGELETKGIYLFIYFGAKLNTQGIFHCKGTRTLKESTSQYKPTRATSQYNGPTSGAKHPKVTPQKRRRTKKHQATQEDIDMRTVTNRDQTRRTEERRWDNNPGIFECLLTPA